MKTNGKNLLFFFLILISVNALAQKQNIRFERLSGEEAFSQSLVVCVLKDRYGFLWIGTDDGLNKYDGYKITSYRNDPKNEKSIGANFIYTVYEDSKGNLWIGTDGGGLNLYDRNTNSFVRFLHNPDDPSSLKDNSVRKICEDREGNIWVGTYYGLDLKISNTGKFKHYTIGSFQKGAPTEQITSLLCDSRNNLWIGTLGGLAVLDPRSQRFGIHTNDGDNKNSISDNRIASILEDEEKNIWIGTQNGLNLLKGNKFIRFHNDEKNIKTISHNQVWALAGEGNGKVWVGTENGLDLFDTKKEHIVHYRNVPGDDNSLPHNSLRSIYVDKEKIMWIGCAAGGIRKYDKKLSQFRVYKPLNSDPVSLNLKMVYSFAETKSGDIWIGTDGGGLNVFRKKDNSFSHFEYKKNDPSHSLLSGAVIKLLNSRDNEHLWIGTYGGGLSCYKLATNSFKHYTVGEGEKHLSDNNVYALMEDRNGNLWVGTNNGGVNVLHPHTKNFTKLPYGLTEDSVRMTNSCIRSFYEDIDGSVWIGTYGAGINIYDPVTKKFSYLNKKTSGLSNDIVLSIHRDNKGNIWAATMGGGLNLYDKKKNRFYSFTEQDGLVNNVVNNIQEDKNGFLWLSTKKGISRFDPVTKRFKNYSLNYGLQGYEFLFGSGFTASTGEIYFGGADGFNVLDPYHIQENTVLPPVVITGFQLSNKLVSIGENSLLKKDISITESITLPYDKSMLSLEFAALNFTAPEKNQYAYKLEGFDKDWIYSGSNRTATYTNLDPGEYTFRVKASNNDGVWNEKGTSIKIKITPPFWQTWWFKLLATAVLLGSVYVVYRIRMKTIELQKIQLEKQVQERTQSLMKMTQEVDHANKELERKNKELEQFAYVASHDMQEPLRTISSFVELLNVQYKDRFDEKAQKYMTYIVQASDRMKVLIKDLLEYSRIGKKRQSATVDLNGLVDEVLQDLQVAIKEADAEIRVEKLPVIQAYPTEMKQLFQNLIANAIKFRKKGQAPIVTVKAEQKNEGWQFMVRDNGIGIDPKQTDRIFVIFQRLHTRNEYDGSGIGLSHCKKIAELHKGKIWVESAPGEGSSFFFTVKELNGTSLHSNYISN